MTDQLFLKMKPPGVAFGEPGRLAGKSRVDT
jgi:hypothetical protein